jgi:prolyl 4-hydroxylase
MQQLVTPELIHWIAEQRQAGYSESTILHSMMTTGWSQSTALAALAQKTVISSNTIKSHQSIDSFRHFSAELPEPKVSEGATSLWAGDREVNVLFAMKRPRLVVFGSFMTNEECDALCQAASPYLVRSKTVKLDEADPKMNEAVHEARTSDGMFFHRGQNDLCQRIESRIATLLNWPVDHGEGLQVLHYKPGAEYKPHYDYFEPGHPASASFLQRGGQRVGTLLMYLNTPVRGGSTSFPDVDLEVSALKGNAVFFSYEQPDPSTRTLHGGSPVIEGEKWIATKWLRQDHFG